MLLLALASFVSNAAAQEPEEEFEMKQYYFVFYNAVPDRPVLDSAEAMKIQEGHIGHLTRLWKEGKSILAGPFLDKGETRGIVILDVATLEEAQALCKEDPAVINGRLTAAIRPWYGPANLIVKAKKTE